ncbi:hypothetical protein BJV77DRAFT_1121581 [Russula vinacea]|nr:hypothetical protein BJV77DRAFT_1121581 [Russula vinacea]
MGPRPSISGELPIHSYFNSAGATWNKDKGSTKRRTAADADEANRTRPKRQRTGQSSKGNNLEVQEKSRSDGIVEWHPDGSAEVRTKAQVTGVSGTTSIPTPISVVKLPHSTSSRAPADMEVIIITSSSPPRATLLDTEDAVRTARDTASRSSLPTPQTVSRAAKKNFRTDAVPPPTPTVSRSVMNSGPTIPSFPQRPPLTPSRPRSKANHIPLVHRTTPHSQRIVPSSQWSDDDSCPEELTLSHPRTFHHVKFRVPACPTFIELASGQGHSLENNIDTGNSEDTRTRPLSLSGPSRFVLPLSNCLGLQDRGQSSQIEPTSQVDEIELKVPSQRLFVDPILSAQANHCDVVPSIERSQPGLLQDWSSHSEAVAEQESSSTNSRHEPSPPSSPLTPLSSSSLLSNAMHGNMDTMGANRSPSQRAMHIAPESPAPRSSPSLCSTPSRAEIPLENPTPREDGNL